MSAADAARDAMQRAPSPFQIEQAMSALMSARQRLIEIDPSIEQDDRLFADMLEGEGGTAMDVLHRILRASVDAKDMASAADARAAEITGRRDRYRRRAEVLRGVAFAAMDALALRKIELPDLTATISAGTPRVVVTDDTALPDEFVRIKREPDKAAIGDALKAGNHVTGAEMSNGIPHLTVRTK